MNIKKFRRFALLFVLFCVLATGRIFAQTLLPGDANEDGIVNGADFSVWLNNYGRVTPTPVTNSHRSGDFNSDGIVNGADFSIWLSHYGQRINTTPTPTPPPSASFNFISWSDVQGTNSSGAGYPWTANANVVGSLADKPEFTIFNGDVCSSGFTTTCVNEWIAPLKSVVISGSLTLADKTFPVRGNHDSSDAAGWSAYFNMSKNAANIGATNYRTDANAPNRTYSFDYGNSHFVGLDVPGAVNLMTAAQITWLDGDLTAAESRGLVHAFLFFHGAVSYVDGHSSTPPAALITVLNKHSIITATFHGHEHVKAYVHVNSSRISTLTHPFLEVVSAVAGSPGLHDSNYVCQPARYDAVNDWCTDDKTASTMFFSGFADVKVSGQTVTVNYYDTKGAIRKAITITK